MDFDGGSTNTNISGFSQYGPVKSVLDRTRSISKDLETTGGSSPVPSPSASVPTERSAVAPGLKKWASIYGRGGKKQLKQFTPSQERLFKDLNMEAYDVVLDYLLSEGHAETVEEAHYVMMQMDAEYVQSIVEAGLPIPPGGIKPDRLNPIDPATGKPMYKVVPGASGKPKEIRNPSFGKLPPA